MSHCPFDMQTASPEGSGPHGHDLNAEMDAVLASLQSIRENLHLLRRSKPEQVVALEVCPGLFVQVDAALLAPRQGAGQ